MNIINCPYGHYYDADEFEICPKCISVHNEEEKESLYSKSEIPTTSTGNSDMGKKPTVLLRYSDNNENKLYKVPNGILSIGNEAFDGCRFLQKIIMPISLTSIGNAAFRNCESLQTITIPGRVSSIGNYAFEGCYSLNMLSIKNGVSLIGNYAFKDCYSLTKLTIPNSVVSIGENAFEGCEALRTITIPNSVAYIGEYAFKNWTHLQTIYVMGRSRTPSGWSKLWDSNCNAKIIWNA